jgi:TatA/E family protein of Tat protein translocase
MSILSPTLAFLSSGDIFVVMFLCLLLFGSKKLPELGQSMREFKKAQNEVEDNFHAAVREEDRKKAVAATPPAAPVATPPAAPTEKL